MIALRSLREERGYSQKEIASALNVATSTYNQWETGKREPDYETLRRIADYFHVTTDYLLGRESPVSDENGQKEKAPAGEPAEAPSRDQMIEDIIRIYRRMSDAEKLDFLARLNAPKGT